MKKLLVKFICFTFLLFSFSEQIFSQNPAEDDDSVKISTNEIRFDAIVTDDKGNQIKDLTISDFEIYQDGKLQRLNSLIYVDLEKSAELRRSIEKSKEKISKNTVFVPPNASTNGRLLTFIVDDGNCTASLSGMESVRAALEKFITQQMQPNDLVAIYRTRNGSSLLQQYTSDKAVIFRAIRQIRWLPPAVGCVGFSGNFFEAARNDSTLRSGQGTFESESSKINRENLEDGQRDRGVVGTLGVINYVIKGLAKVSGRKTVFFLSDGMPLYTRNGGVAQALDILRDTTEAANRASVTFNTITAQGLFSSDMISAGDDVNPNQTDALRESRMKEVRNSQSGLSYLADQTGGRFFYGQNDLNNPIGQVLNREKGYYLLSYEPDDETFKGKKYHKIEIKIKRPDLKVSSREGFYGVSDDKLTTKPRTGDSELYEAIVSPLARAGLNVQLNAFYSQDSKIGDVIRANAYVEGSQLTFTDENPQMKKISFS